MGLVGVCAWHVVGLVPLSLADNLHRRNLLSLFHNSFMFVALNMFQYQESSKQKCYF